MSVQGYDPSTGYMDFSLALREMKRGKTVKRACWRSLNWRMHGDGIKDNEGCDVMFIYPGELLATDWEEVL